MEAIEKKEERVGVGVVCSRYRMDRYTEFAFKKIYTGQLKTMSEWQKILLKKGII